MFTCVLQHHFTWDQWERELCCGVRYWTPSMCGWCTTLSVLSAKKEVYASLESFSRVSAKLDRGSHIKMYPDKKELLMLGDSCRFFSGNGRPCPLPPGLWPVMFSVSIGISATAMVFFYYSYVILLKATLDASLLGGEKVGHTEHHLIINITSKIQRRTISFY